MDDTFAALTTSSADPTRQSKIKHAGSINITAFKACVSVFFVTAITTVILRLVIRFKMRHWLSVDDYLVLLAASALSVCTAIVFKMLPAVYLLEAVDQFHIAIEPSEVGIVLDQLKWFHIYVPIMWLSIFAIKFAFLYYFHGLVWQLSKAMVRYYWAVVIFVAISWLLLSFSLVMACPYTGIDSFKCSGSDQSQVQRQLVINILTGVIDVMTDALIVTIPLLVLRSSLMPTSQKISVAALLCLSIFMIIVATIRVTGPKAKVNFTSRKDYNVTQTWILYLSQIEACTAVIMASVIAIRSVFLKKALIKPSRKVRNARPMVLPSWWRSTENDNDIADHTKAHIQPLPSQGLTHVTLMGQTSPLRDATADNATLEAGHNLMELDYHHVREQH
ncbi:hypothetical protein BDV95DRAFT_25254 [Massariosphaeria phaeospora]|uniref:Rhodopsin domain-containing protein n=1 Tax=Massariosphaeria phaeospora TaxID=100035 RepID=A0A7C8MHN3_9PLEO|nr:hypothetical protein BDV95DRAFT_25254 [Massariosphaeria phaeospora]